MEKYILPSERRQQLLLERDALVDYLENHSGGIVSYVNGAVLERLQKVRKELKELAVIEG